MSGMVRRGNKQTLGQAFLTAGLLVALTSSIAAADSFSSTDFKIDASVGGPLGGTPASTHYKMVVSGGETAAGSASSSSYALSYGYVAQLSQSIQLTNLTPSVTFGTLTAGSSGTVALNYQVQTDAPGYGLTINENHDMQKSSDTIPAISPGDLTTPVAWSEGTTKGLGLTITSAPSVPSKWGNSASGYKYAAIPTSPTTLYSRSGFTGGVTDTIALQGRVDVTASQPNGNYSNTVTLTATTTP